MIQYLHLAIEPTGVEHRAVVSFQTWRHFAVWFSQRKFKQLLDGRGLKLLFGELREQFFWDALLNHLDDT